MTLLFVSDRADRDIDAIFDALNQSHGITAVAALDADLRKLYRRITDFPQSGPLRPALGSGIRIGVVAPYLLIYRYDASYDAVNVLRIVHGRRNVKAYLLGP